MSRHAWRGLLNLEQYLFRRMPYRQVEWRLDFFADGTVKDIISTNRMHCAKFGNKPSD